MVNFTDLNEGDVFRHNDRKYKKKAGKKRRWAEIPNVVDLETGVAELLQVALVLQLFLDEGTGEWVENEVVVEPVVAEEVPQVEPLVDEVPLLEQLELPAPSLSPNYYTNEGLYPAKPKPSDDGDCCGGGECDNNE